jgi:hypothetical protein
MDNINNKVYDAVKNSFILLDLDNKNIGKDDWNPLSEIVNPGDRVLIKPNAVFDFSWNINSSVFSLITHESIIRTVIDYVFIDLKGSGEIIISDAPLAYFNFEFEEYS